MSFSVFSLASVDASRANLISLAYSISGPGLPVQPVNSSPARSITISSTNFSRSTPSGRIPSSSLILATVSPRSSSGYSKRSSSSNSNSSWSPKSISSSSSMGSPVISAGRSSWGIGSPSSSASRASSVAFKDSASKVMVEISASSGHGQALSPSVAP